MCAAFDFRWAAPAALDDPLLLPLLKIGALLATAVAVHRSLSPPNPPPPPKSVTRIDNRSLFERAIRHVTFCSKMITCAVVLADALVTLDLALPNPYTRPLAAQLLPSPCSPSSSSSPSLLPPTTSSPPTTSTTAETTSLGATLTHPTPLLLLGTALALAGAALRIWCFRALGTLFTFELTICPAHTLVRAGPYARVRHPSYTGVAATLAGASLAMLAPGAWLAEAWLVPGLRCAASAAAALPSPFEASARAPVAVSYPGPGLDSVQAARAGAGAGMDAECGCAGYARGALLAWALAAFWTVKVVYALRSTLARVGAEDAALRRVFGAEWEDWAARVRWRLVPGVY